MSELRQSNRPRRPRPPGRTNHDTPGTSSRYRNQLVHVPEGYLIVGRIIAAHGLRGEIRVELHTDFPDRFAPGQKLYVGKELAPVEIVAAREHKNLMLLQVNGVRNRSEAEELRGRWLYIRETEAAMLEEDAFWVHDIVGLRVATVDGQHLGMVKEVLFTGANEVFIVSPTEGVNRGRELLLPAISEVIQHVDINEGEIVVQLLPGLLEE